MHRNSHVYKLKRGLIMLKKAVVATLYTDIDFDVVSGDTSRKTYELAQLLGKTR